VLCGDGRRWCITSSVTHDVSSLLYHSILTWLSSKLCAHTYTEQYTLQPDKTLASFMQKQSKPSTLNKVNAVIAIASGKGGVGKSTVAGKLSKYIHERRWYNVYL
jgi:Mrp family chromosome partitioning ATPase